DQTDWSNFGSSVQGVGQIAGQVGSAVEFGIGKFGSEKLKKGLAQVKGFLKSAEKDFKQFESTVQGIKKEVESIAGPLLQEGEALLKELKKLGKDELPALVSGLASGAPISFDKEKRTLQLDLKGARRILLGDLEGEFRQILDAGGAVFNDAEFRKGGIS